MITFIVGKIPGEVKEVVFDGESLTVAEAVKLGAEVCGFTYNPAEIVYLNSVVVSNDAIVRNNDVVLVDIPKIKGAQMVVKVGRSGMAVKTIALHDHATVREALSVASVVLDTEEAGFINGVVMDISSEVNDGDLLVVKNRSSVVSTERCIDIYAAIAQLRADLELLKSEIS